MTDNVEFRLTADECMHTIIKGDDFFVIDINGSQSRVIIGAQKSRSYLGDPGGTTARPRCGLTNKD